MNTPHTEQRAWHRRADESSRSHAALLIFLRSGPSRSIAGVGAEIGLSVHAVRKLSDKHSWIERSRAYDNFLADAIVQHDADAR